MKGTVQLDISNATEEAPIESELLDIGGFKCQLRYPVSGRADAIWVAFNEQCQDRLWLCKAKFSFEEMTANGGWDTGGWKKVEEWKPDYRFPHTSFHRKFHCKKPSAIKVHVDILWAANEANLPVLDTDLVLKMGKKSDVIHVNKFCLAMHSSYFRDLFFGEWQDDAGTQLEEAGTGRKQYTIQKDSSFQLWQFRFLLYGTHVFGCRLNEHPDLWQWRQHKDHEELNIELLRMATKYRLPLFVEFAEQLLIKSGPGTMAMLEVADQLKLEELKSHCLNSIDLIEYGKQFAKNKKIHTLLEDETRKALDAKLEESANKIMKPVFF